MSLSVANPSQGSYGLLMRLLRLILGLRSISRRLSKSYYRLARGMETGYTVGDGSDTTLDELREEFEADLERVRTLTLDWPDMTAEERYAADEIKAISSGGGSEWGSGELDQSIEDWLESAAGNETVAGEEFAWSDDRVSDLEDANRAFRSLLKSRGIDDLESRIRDLKRRYGNDPDRLLAEIEDTFLTVRDTVAGIVDKSVIDAGRELLDDTITRDTRAKYVARGVRANPCHFCSMLASRGFVYKSERTALSGWHPNCHCYAIVRFGDDPQLPERNDYYVRMWPTVTADYDGKDKVKAWRRWIAAERKKRR